MNDLMAKFGKDKLIGMILGAILAVAGALGVLNSSAVKQEMCPVCPSAAPSPMPSVIIIKEGK